MAASTLGPMLPGGNWPAACSALISPRLTRSSQRCVGLPKSAATLETAVRIIRSRMPSTLAMCALVRSLSITAAMPVRMPLGPRTTGMPPPPPAMTTVPRRASTSISEMSTMWRGFGDGTTWRQPRPEVLAHQPAELGADGLGLLLGEEGADRLAGVREGRIGGVDLDLRQHAGDVAGAVGFAQRVLQRLHEQVGDAALAVRHADVERHRRNAVAGQRLPHQDLADHGAVAVGDHQLVVEQRQRQQRLGGACGDDLLLVGRAADFLRMRGIAADGDHEAFGDRSDALAPSLCTTEKCPSRSTLELRQRGLPTEFLRCSGGSVSRNPSVSKPAANAGNVGCCSTC